MALNAETTYIPSYKIAIGGDIFQMGQNDLIRSVTVEDFVKGPDTFSVTFVARHKDWRAGHFHHTDFEYLDTSLCAERERVTIHMGYRNDMRPMIEGRIVSIETNFSMDGAPLIMINGKSLFCDLEKVIAMHNLKRWSNERIDTIVAMIAGEAGFGSEIEACDLRFASRQQNQISYAAFLKEIADMIEWEYSVKWNSVKDQHNLIFQSPQFQSSLNPPIILKWGDTIRSFYSRITTQGIPTKVLVRADRTQGRVGKTGAIVGIADHIEQNKVMGEVPATEVVKEHEVLITIHAVPDEYSAEWIAQSYMNGKSMGYLTGTLEIVGNPRIRAGEMIELQGVGSKLSGLYYASRVTHTIDESGYSTKIFVQRNARGRLK